MRDRDLEHPIITRTERDGLPDRAPHCPVCEDECDHVYREIGTNHILGCENCLIEENAWETAACFPGEENI